MVALRQPRESQRGISIKVKVLGGRDLPQTDLILVQRKTEGKLALESASFT